MSLVWNGHGTMERWQDARREATRRAMAETEPPRCCRGIAYACLVLVIMGAVVVILGKVIL